MMTDSRLHTLSIVIPCYNEKDTIAQLLESVLNVNISYHKEIIIVDDCSKDGTQEILQSFSAKLGGGGKHRLIAPHNPPHTHYKSSTTRTIKAKARHFAQA